MSIPLFMKCCDPDPIFEWNNSKQGMPIVIDNGSHTCRVGFANQSSPHMTFKNVVLKPRFKKDTILVGNDIQNIESVRNNIRISFDRNLVTQFEIQEYVFDHIFSKLGIESECVDHPVIINEAVCNPNLCRSQMSELLFECYGVPKLTYYIDALASYAHEFSKQNQYSKNLPDGLLVSFGYHTVHFLPILDSFADYKNAKRINIGGSYCDWFMQRLLQLKYPSHINHITLSLGEKIFQDYARVSVNYREEMLSYKNPEILNKSLSKILQLPYDNSADSNASHLSQQRRQIQVQRLKEAHKKRQQDRLASEQEQFSRLSAIQDLVTHGYNEYCAPKNKSELNTAIRKAFKASDIKSIHHLKERIEHCQKVIKRLECALLGEEYQEEEKKEENAKPKDIYHLIHILDEDLDPDELKVKRKQLMLKANNERRQKIKALKEDQRRKTLEGVKQLETQRDNDFLGWLTSLRFKRQHLIESRIQRKNRKGGSAMTGTSHGSVSMTKADRKLHQQNKMRQITSQVVAGGTQSSHDSKSATIDNEEHQLDAEFDVKDNDSDESDMEQEQLNTLDSLLAQYDPEFSKDLGGVGLKVDLQQYYQLHLTTEQVRVPELFFHPRLIGCDQAGIPETIACVFNSYSPELQQRLANNVVLTGSVAQLPGMQERISAEVRMIRPYQTYSCVSIVSDPQLGAWLGARQMVMDTEFSDKWTSKAEYEECGHDYLKEHSVSNRFWTASSDSL